MEKPAVDKELLREVRRLQIRTDRLVTDVVAGGYSSVFRGSGIEFDEVREWTEGDDFRSVDWNVTARQGRPFIKKYVEERERTVVCLLDTSASMDGGFSTWSVRGVAARIAACLALSAVQNDDKVGLIGVSDEIDGYVPPRKGMSHVLRIVRDCLVMPAKSPSGDLGVGLDFVARVLRRHAIVFMISDFVGWNAPDALGACARRHDVVAVRLLPHELREPPRGMLRVRDPESGRVRVVDFGHRRQRELYLERVAEWRRRCDESFARSRIDVMDVEVPFEPDLETIAKPILEFFRMRTARGAKG
jgi:uncharacterized protein (DUF58 family)